MKDSEWVNFCNSQLKVFEKKWTTKLEDYGKEENDMDKFLPKPIKDDESRRFKDLQEQEDQIGSMLNSLALK